MNFGSMRPTRERMRTRATAAVRDDSMLTAEGVSTLRDRLAAQVEALTAKIDAMPEGMDRTTAVIARLAMESKLEEIEGQLFRMETKGNTDAVAHTSEAANHRAT